jgi:hypothetical protein
VLRYTSCVLDGREWPSWPAISRGLLARAEGRRPRRSRRDGDLNRGRPDSTGRLGEPSKNGAGRVAELVTLLLGYTAKPQLTERVAWLLGASKMGPTQPTFDQEATYRTTRLQRVMIHALLCRQAVRKHGCHAPVVQQVRG